jgi:hypothetical protein
MNLLTISWNVYLRQLQKIISLIFLVRIISFFAIRILFLFLVLSLTYSKFQILYPQIKHSAVSIPIGFSNFKDEGVKRILQNYINNQLSLYYSLKSERELKQAAEAASDEVSSQECTSEDACILLIGKFLDVDYTFITEIIVAGNLWDITIKRMDISGNVSIKNSGCDGCSLNRAKKELLEMTFALRPGGVVVLEGKAMMILSSYPSGKVFLNGIPQGNTPVNLIIDTRSPAQITVTKEGYADYINVFRLKPGDKRKESINLARETGTLMITSDPSGATIFLDDKPKLNVAGEPLKTPVKIRSEYGTRPLTLMLNGYQRFKKTIKVNEKDMGTIHCKLEPNPGRVMVKIPWKYRNMSIYKNNTILGGMKGETVQSFELGANISHSLQAKNDDFISEKIKVKINPEEVKRVSFKDFKKVRKKFTLNIDVYPDDAKIELYKKGYMDLKIPFFQGKEISQGKYEVIISKNGYKTHNETVTIENDNSKLLVSLILKTPTAFEEWLEELEFLGLTISRVVFTADLDSYDDRDYMGSGWSIGFEFGKKNGYKEAYEHYFALHYLSSDYTPYDSETYLSEGGDDGDTKNNTVNTVESRLIRLLYAPTHSPGWIYAFGIEYFSTQFETDSGNVNIVSFRPLIEGGYQLKGISSENIIFRMKLQIFLPLKTIYMGYTIDAGYQF